MRHSKIKLAAFAFLLVIASIASGVHSRTSRPAGTPATPASGSVMVGQPFSATQPPELSPALKEALSTSHEGLVEVPTEGGGYMVDLKGRFQSLTIATIDPVKGITIQCFSGTPAAEQQRCTDDRDSLQDRKE